MTAANPKLSKAMKLYWQQPGVRGSRRAAALERERARSDELLAERLRKSGLSEDDVQAELQRLRDRREAMAKKN